MRVRRSLSPFPKILTLSFIGVFLISCGLDFGAKNTRGTKSSHISPLKQGEAYLMLQSPMEKNPQKAELPLQVKFFIEKQPLMVTLNQTLTYHCSFNHSTVSECLRSKRDENTAPLKRKEGHWNQKYQSEAYLQVHSLFHAKRLIERFYDALKFSTDYSERKNQNLQQNPWSLAPSIPFLNSLSSNSLFWLKPSTSPQLISPSLDLLTFCPDSKDGTPVVFYEPAKRILCLGSYKFFKNTGFHFAQDPHVIYHEMGHVMVDIMMNLRNSYLPIRSDLGFSSFDEAGSINEGIADYFSYIMTGKERLAPWALGKGLEGIGFNPSMRPMSESDSLHMSGISDNSNERLSYPQYVNYNVYSPTEEHEDIHNSGKIASHYLVSLTKDLKSTCSIDQKKAENYVLMILLETMAELGDLSAKGSDFNTTSHTFFHNFSPQLSYDWIKTTNPINFKRFFQVFAKYSLHRISMDLCRAYSKNQLEKNLDNYGLLLFPDYQDQGLDTKSAVSMASIAASQGQGTPIISPQEPNKVNILNRSKTTLISKTQVSIPSLQDTAPQVYLIDSKEFVDNLIASKAFMGSPLRLTLSTKLSDTSFNNDNRYFSPGEIVGLSFNLVNNSNIPVSGVQVLGNNWDHLKREKSDDEYPKICQFEGFPSLTGGGIKDLPNTPPQPGDCQYAYRGGNTNLDKPQPICVVQKKEGDKTTWITQDEFRASSNLGSPLSNSECLGPEGQQNPNECLVRIVPGGDFSVFSKINPGKTWAQTISADKDNPTLPSSGFLIMELSKWIPKGTIFNCRLRVRFSNCSDCYQNSNGQSYPDYEYQGAKPYKIIHFQFPVLN